MLGAGNTEGSETDMILPLRELTFCWENHQNKLLQIMTSPMSKNSWVMEALDIRINVERDDIVKIEYSFTYWTSENIEF